MRTTSQLNQVIDHFFRHEAGKMVSVLTRLFGFSNMQQAEDIVQDALIKALETWKYKGLPDNPRAWLYQVAKNRALDVVRRSARYQEIVSKAALPMTDYNLNSTVDHLFEEDEIKDSQLRMMFACCHPSLSAEGQISLMLKTLCGLSIEEIANAFLSNKETITKRLYRARDRIRDEATGLDYPGNSALPERLDSVLKALYLLFNEGYNSSNAEKLIREDLCDDAMRLTHMLTEGEHTRSPKVFALLALMCFQAARFDARLDDRGSVLLLHEQDRSLWNQELIERGNAFLGDAAEGAEVSSFQIEAAIASCHVSAPSFRETNWPLLLQLYDTLLTVNPSPIVELNRAIVVAELSGPEAALSSLQAIKELEKSSYYHTALGEMYSRSGQESLARERYQDALSLSRSEVEQQLIQRKIKTLTKATEH